MTEHFEFKTQPGLFNLISAPNLIKQSRIVELTQIKLICIKIKSESNAQSIRISFETTVCAYDLLKHTNIFFSVER
jgi:hypothetical protein